MFKKTAVLLILCFAALLSETGCGKETAVPQTREAPSETNAQIFDAVEGKTDGRGGENSGIVSAGIGTGMPEEGEDLKKLNETGRSQYRVDLTIERPSDMNSFLYVRGKQTITFRNDSEDIWDHIVLREYSPAILGGEIWEENGSGAHGRPFNRDEKQSTGIESISMDGKPLTFGEHKDPSVIKVQLDQPMRPGEAAALELAYTLKVAAGSARQGFELSGEAFATDRDSADSIVVMLGPFIPTIPVYEDGKWADGGYFSDGECFYTKCSDYYVTASLPDGFTAAASGREQRMEDGKYIFTAENTRDFALIAGDKLGCLEEQWDDVSVRIWFCNNGQDVYASAAKEALDTAVDAVRIFSDYFGEYTYDELDVVFCSYHNVGMEYPGMVRMDESCCFLLRAVEDSYEENKFRTGLVHEIAHEWFYSAVGNDQFDEPWLDEGFATFCELVFLEESGRTDRAAGALEGIRSNYAATGGAPVNVSCGECDTDSWRGSYSYGKTVYNGGALFLYELRAAMGDAAFRTFVHNWYTENVNREVTTEQFLRRLQETDDSEAVRSLVSKYFRR